ncbi:MAG: anti-sigma factor antagonist [Candidatus Hydrogenedentota bacterium]|nr:MAG: anti-sigma factor antagonist [Candidatus Hydrogenedentota bacterium]
MNCFGLVSLEVHKEDLGNVLIYHLIGELDAYTSDSFEKEVSSTINEKARTYVLDLSGLDFISSTGIGLIVGLREQLKEKNLDLKLAEAQESVKRIFEIVGLDEIFVFYNTVEEAIQQMT